MQIRPSIAMASIVTAERPSAARVTTIVLESVRGLERPWIQAVPRPSMNGIPRKSPQP
jgi:hypothetical protein